MADVMDLPPEPLPRDERRRERVADRKERPSDERRRDRDPRERRGGGGGGGEDRGARDERDDRPPRREYHDKRGLPEERPSGGLASASAAERKERDRDYKRRKSPSPPPYSHRERERRYSPSRRSPPYKRSRGDDDYDAPRRGSSPRSGMMPVDDSGRSSGYDRRYGYDGLSSYDKMGSAGGRGGSYSGDERNHGRHLGSRSDWPSSGRSGFPDGPYSYGGAPRREGLMTYKQFIGELEDDISPAEAERRYEEYKNEFISTQKRSFFEQNKDEEWLRDKYDPSHLEAVIQRRNDNCRTVAKEFTGELEAGTLDMSPKSLSALKSKHDEEHASDEDADATAKRRRGRGPIQEHQSETTLKVPASSSDPRRVPKDIEQARALIRKMDGEKGIEGNILVVFDQEKSEGEKSMSGGGMDPIVIVRGADQVKGYEGLELLDLMLTYLWRVHSVDYYGMLEYKEPPKVPRHVRTEGKGNEDTATASEWEKKLDTTWQGRLQGQDPLEILLGKEKLEIASIEALDPFVRKIRDEKYGWKYGCGAKGCTKLFHGPEYVHKHLKLKHPELVNDAIIKIREDLYYQNYMSDPDAPGATPIMASQPGLRDRTVRRRPSANGGGSGSLEQLPSSKAGAGLPSSSSRGARDAEGLDRGSGRDNERFERIHEDDCYDRGTEDSPSGDYPPAASGGSPYDVAGSSGPYEGGRPDASIFDPFGPAMRGPHPLGSDLPMHPPVLIPVPGAGPLGPFVPAPPEVAVRMLREQGGPLPFHPGVFDGLSDNVSGGPRGRKRPGPSSGPLIGAGMMDAPMIMPLPPALRHDPRRVRSYHDLDAPEDEITVLDYRSL